MIFWAAGIDRFDASADKFDQIRPGKYQICALNLIKSTFPRHTHIPRHFEPFSVCFSMYMGQLWSQSPIVLKYDILGAALEETDRCESYKGDYKNFTFRKHLPKKTISKTQSTLIGRGFLVVDGLRL